MKDLKLINQIIEYAQKTADSGITFKTDIIDWNEPLVFITVTDASFANEDAVVKNPMTGKKHKEKHRSQGGVLIFLAHRDALDDKTKIFKCHLICFNSHVVKRVCRATIQAECYTLQNGVERAERLRAVFADLHFQLNLRQWELQSGSFIHNIWFTDCKSVYDACVALANQDLAQINDCPSKLPLCDKTYGESRMKNTFTHQLLMKNHQLQPIPLDGLTPLSCLRIV